MWIFYLLTAIGLTAAFYLVFIKKSSYAKIVPILESIQDYAHKLHDAEDENDFKQHVVDYNQFKKSLDSTVVFKNESVLQLLALIEELIEGKQQYFFHYKKREELQAALDKLTKDDSKRSGKIEESSQGDLS